jgi:hypothetical protein
MLKKFMDSLSQYLSTLLASSNVNDKCGALSAICKLFVFFVGFLVGEMLTGYAGELLEVNFPDTATNRISWFYKFLVKPLENTDPAVFTPAAKCFGGFSTFSYLLPGWKRQESLTSCHRETTRINRKCSPNSDGVFGTRSEESD